MEQRTYKLPKALAIAASVIGFYACESGGCASYKSGVKNLSMEQKQVQVEERPAAEHKSLDKLF